MADTKISSLVSLTGAGAAQDDLIPIVDVTASETKKITRDEFFTSVDRVRFDTSGPYPAPLEGELTWDSGEKTLSLGLNGGQATLQIGQESHFRVHNSTGVAIPNGTVVRHAGGVGASGQILVAPALADGTYHSSWILGLTTENINNGADGLVTYFGKVRGINTSGFLIGDIVYADPSVSGGLTKIRPAPPNNIVSIGVVLAASNNGTILVRPRIHDIWVAPPASATSQGTTGDNAFDNDYFYVCVATNTWKRVALSTWP